MRTRRPLHSYLLTGLALAALVGLPLHVADAEEASSRMAEETVVVKRGPLGATIKSKGVLVPLKHKGVSCKPDEYRGALKIAEVAKEGKVVEGQTLVRFEEEDYAKQLEERERGLVAQQMRVERQTHDFKLKQREAAVAMDEAIRRKQQADESLKRYLDFERKTREMEAVLGFQGSRDRITDQQEELEQLEKMYNEDDLTEETEEIVLNRARRSLERALKYQSFRKNRHDYNMEVLLPRRHEDLRLRVRKATNTLDRLEATQPIDLKKAEMDLDKARRDLASAEEKLAKFRADRAKLTVKAPMAGYAVAGSFGGGKWTGLGALEGSLQVGKTVKAGQTLFTVVNDATLRVHTSVKEKDLLQVAAGGPATVICDLTGKDKFEAVVESVSRYGTGGSHAVVLRVTTKDKRLRTGLACAVELPKASNDEVLSVPKSALHKEKDGMYVFVHGTDGEPTKTKVEVGDSAAGRVEITSGVKAGQKVLKTPPAAKEDDKK